MHRYLTGLATLVICAAVPAGATTFDLVLAPLAPPSESQQVLLDEGEAFWEAIITGYQPGIDIPEVTVSIGAPDLDGPDGTLASASVTDGVDQAGYILPTASIIDFDIADLETLEEDGDLFGILLHEIAHALGFGNLWRTNDLYETDSGEYRASNGLNAYRAEFDVDAEFVPVDIVSGIGTANTHWDEDWAGGPNALMTGFYDAPVFLSDTTVGSFRDLGYTTVAVVGDMVPIPLPASAGLLLGALGSMGLRRRRVALR